MLNNAFPYKTFSEANSVLFGILPIDYFLAKHVCEALPNQSIELIAHITMWLSMSSREGHSYLPLSAIGNHRWGYETDQQGIVTHQGYSFPSTETLEQTFQLLNILPEHNEPIVYYDNGLFLRRYFAAEQQLCTLIADKIKQPLLQNEQLLQQAITTLFPETKQSVTQNKAIDWQKVAVANALSNRFSVIAGGPGTGKTYTVAKLMSALLLVELLNDKSAMPKESLVISMVAPTGKAAQRLSESINKAKIHCEQVLSQTLTSQDTHTVISAIPQKASTIHRLLGVIPNKNQFKHHSTNLLPCDVLLVDEVSMVDLALFNQLFTALKPSCRVILLGDSKQLPSVNTGNVLAELIPDENVYYSDNKIRSLEQLLNSQQLSTVLKTQKRKTFVTDYLTILKHSRRFDGTGGIGQLAQSIVKGEASKSWSIINEGTQAGIHRVSNDSTTWLEEYVKHYYMPINSCNSLADAFTQMNKFRILCVTKQGPDSVEYYNDLVEQLLLSYGLKEVNNDFYHGQPIMIEQNNYSLGVFNGDIGFIWRHHSGQLMAVFEQENLTNKNEPYLWIMLSRLPKHSTVYAMTIHKTQGSEFNHVMMALPEQIDHPLLSRELIYTGLTRAKSQFSIRAKQSVWQHTIERPVQRFSTISKELSRKLSSK